MQTLHSGVSFQIHKPILCGIHWARCPSRSKVACRSQEPEAASQCRCPQQTKHQNPSPFEAQHQACTSKPPGSDAQQSRYTSSALSNGVDSWQHNAQMGTGRGRSIGCNMYAQQLTCFDVICCEPHETVCSKCIVLPARQGARASTCASD